MLGEQLLIYLHIPKTAGTTLASHIKGNLQPAEWLALYGIRRTREAITRQIADLAPDQRKRIRFVFGHQVWFGIHELFDREPRYVTVLREPTSRVVSHFYHLARNPRSVYFNKIGRGEITLDSWLAGESNPHTINQMTRFLSRQSVGHEPGSRRPPIVDQSMLQRALGNLSQLWFVGLTASLDSDLPLLLARLGLNRSGQDERPGEPESRIERLNVDEAMLATSYKRNWADHVLYSYGTMLHEKIVMEFRQWQNRSSAGL